MSVHFYRGYIIRNNDDPAPLSLSFTHEDYDGEDDANDNRAGYGADLQDCIKQIDLIEDED